MFLRLFSERCFLLVVIIDGSEYDQSAETYRRYVQKSADVPSAGLRDLLEYHEGRIGGPYEEHIDAAVGNVSEDQIDGKGNDAYDEKRDCRRTIILHCFGPAPRCDQVKTDENQAHVPKKCVEGERPVGMHDTRGLDERHQTSQQVKGCHKSVHSPFDFFIFDQRGKDAEVHGYAAKLEREDPPLIGILSDVEEIEKLFVNFGQNQKCSDGDQQYFISLLRKIPQFVCEKNAKQKPDEGECQMKRPVSLGRYHFPCGCREKIIKSDDELIHVRALPLI